MKAMATSASIIFRNMAGSPVKHAVDFRHRVVDGTSAAQSVFTANILGNVILSPLMPRNVTQDGVAICPLPKKADIEQTSDFGGN